jgi:hypothetical protein
MITAYKRGVVAAVVICGLLMLGACTSRTAHTLPPFGEGGSDSGGGGMGGH